MERKKQENGVRYFFFSLSHACLIITGCTFVRTTAYHFELSPLCIGFYIQTVFLYIIGFLLYIVIYSCVYVYEYFRLILYVNLNQCD
jgi:high-affinity nickel permease